MELLYSVTVCVCACVRVCTRTIAIITLKCLKAIYYETVCEEVDMFTLTDYLS